MPPPLATIVFGIGVVALFLFDREKGVRVSKALWIPTLWLFFCSSRSLAQWLGMGGMDEMSNEVSDYVEGNPVDRNFYIVLVVIALIVVITRRRRVPTVLRKNWPIGLFFLYAALSMAWSDYPFVTFKHLIKGLGDLLMVLIVFTEPDVFEAVKRLVTRLGFVLVPLSLLLIWYYPALGRTHTMDWTPEPVGVATQKNGLGELCDIYGLAILWRFRNAYKDRKDPNRRRRLLAFGAVLAMIVWLLHLCNSLTSMCALSMGSVVMLLSARPVFRRRPAFMHCLIAGVFVSTMYSLFFSSGSLIQGLGRDATLSGRTTFWPELIKLVRHPLVGVGYESFWLGRRLEKVWVITQGLKISEAHNGYLEIFISLGWIGVALLVALIATGYRNVMSAYRRDPYTGSLRIAWFLAPLITGFTEATFRMMGLPWIVFLLATANTQWDVARKTGRHGLPTKQPQPPPEKPPSLPEEAIARGQYAR